MRDKFLLIAGLAGLLMLSGVIVFHYGHGLGWLDSWYFVVTTMTTVGYAEIHPLSHAGRVFNAFLIFFGVTTIFIAIGAMTQTIIEMEFGDAIGKRRNKRMIEKLKDHYIICGYGRVGRGAAAELTKAGVPFVIVDSDGGKPLRSGGALCDVGPTLLAMLGLEQPREMTGVDLRTLNQTGRA